MQNPEFNVDIEACKANLRRRVKQQFTLREQQRQEARDLILQAINKVIPNYPQINRVYIYGSVIEKGHFAEHSDIDVAVEGTNAKQYWSIWHELSDAFPDRHVDLREINEPSYFANRIKRCGELVYERD